MIYLFSLLLILIFIGLNLAVFGIFKDNKKASKILLYSSAIFFLTYKITEYIYWQIVGLHHKVPIEFSAISYFVFSLAVLTNKKPLINFAVFCAPVAGFFYFLTGIATPAIYLFENDGTFLFIMATFNHALLYLSGLTLLITHKLDRHYIRQAPLFTGISVGYAFFMRWLINPQGSYVILDLAEGNLFNGIIDSSAISGFYAIYYVGLFALLAGFFFIVYFINRKTAHNAQRTAHNGGF
ncbi:MAG: hypothetical protein FWD49_00810 [Firmicutes bacterium]|nr:hypothetical protein [Bacillota bacterium]